MTSNEPTFTRDQRSRLGKLGLCPEQIAELESKLALIQALIKSAESPGKTNDIKGALTDFKDAIEKARDLADKFMNPEKYALDELQQRKEVEGRLLWAANDLAGMGALPQLSESLEGLHTLARIIQKALDDLPKKQRRPFADYRPVEHIDKALLDGFTKAHKPPLPAYTLEVSSSPNSTFREIVGICYEAAGAIYDDPERQIKKYVKVLEWRKARNA